MSIERLKRDLADGKIAPIYVVYGAEELLKREAISAITATALAGSTREFNETRLIYKETTVEDIVGISRTFPMLGGRRLVVVSGIDAMKAKDTKALLAYAQDPPQTTTLLMSGIKVDVRTKLFQTIKKTGKLLKFDAPYQNKIPAWVEQRARDKGVRIDRRAATLLGDIVGNRLAALDESLERLILYVSTPEGTPNIRLEHVEECIARTRVHNVFELADALGRRKTGDAIRILEAMLAAREAPIGILNMIARHLRRLWAAKDAISEGLSADAIGKRIGVNGYFLRDFLRQAELFDHGSYARLLDRCYETDRLLKSSRAPDALHMHRLLFDICLS